MNDELRDILGNELFEELSDLSKNISENDIENVDVLTEEQVEKIANTVFMVQVPMAGTFALELLASLIHAHETGCETCWAEMNWFTISFIGSLVTTMLEDIKGMDDE